MDAYAHDGAAWRKARHIYMHDGTAWRKAREIWAASPTWQCVYQDREFVEMSSSITGVRSVRSSALGLLVATDNGAYQFVGTWLKIGDLTGVIDMIAIGYQLFCATSSDVFYWDSLTWRPCGSLPRSDTTSLGESRGRLFSLTSLNTKYLSGTDWMPYVFQLQCVHKSSNGTSYGINYGNTLYNVDSESIIATSGDPFGHLHLYAKNSNEIYVDGTGGLKKWNGSSFVSLTTIDYRVLMAEDDRGDVIACPSFGGRCTRWNAAGASGPVGASDLQVSWANTGKPMAAFDSGSVYVAMRRSSPNRTTVSKFQLK